jgi:heme exporter protein C
VPGLALVFYVTLFYAPAEATMGEVYRIFFFHLPANIASFILFFVAFVAGVAYLRTRNAAWDMWGVASVEVGILASFVGTVTGSVWARPVWNTWWTWDPRLTTVTIMLLTYVGYAMLRGAVDDPERRARYSAVYAILAFVNVPLVYFSTRILDRTIHPVVFAGENPNAKGEMSLTPEMGQVLMVSMIVLLALFAYLLLRRVRLARQEAQVAQLRVQLLEAADD